MTGNALHSEPQKGIEPLTARAGKQPAEAVPSADEGYTGAVLRASTPEQMQKSRIEERTKSERARKGSDGPLRDGYLTEAALAARWSRSTNTLVGWRTRPHASHDPIPFELFGGVVYYAVETIRAYEADPRHASVRPQALRATPFPPLPITLREAAAITRVTSPAAVQAELPLCSPGEVLPFESRAFERLTISAGYALAVASDGTAWFAEVLGGLLALQWKRVPDLPLDEAAIPFVNFRSQAVAA
jgi:hypothetical protein